MAKTQTTPTLPATSKKKLYLQAAALIKQRIQQNIYQSGTTLPSIRKLSEELKLSHNAVQRAITHLESEHIIQCRHGVGATVIDAKSCLSTALLFGFVQPYYSSYSMLLSACIEEVLGEKSNYCVTKTTHNDPARERQVVEQMIANGVNGLLIWPVDHETNVDFFQSIAARLPVVFVDRRISGVRAPSVVVDTLDMGRQIVRKLIQAKKKRFLFVCDPIPISSYRDLKRGIIRESEQRGIEACIHFDDYPVIHMIQEYMDGNYALADQAYEYFLPLLREGGYDAIFCPNDSFFKYVFIDSNRYDILANIQILAISPAKGSLLDHRRYFEMPLWEWSINQDKMFRTAIEILQDMTYTRKIHKRKIKIPATFIAR